MLVVCNTTVAGQRGDLLLLPDRRNPGSPFSLHCHLRVMSSSSLLNGGRSSRSPLILFIDIVVGMVSLSLGNSESPDTPLRLLWHHPKGGGWAPHYLPVGMEVLAPHVVSIREVYHKEGRCGCLIIASQGWKYRFSIWPLIMQVLVQPQYFSVIFGWRSVTV